MINISINIGNIKRNRYSKCDQNWNDMNRENATYNEEKTFLPLGKNNFKIN